jgi:D-sedoheptulose 7-phosphate isomerase
MSIYELILRDDKPIDEPVRSQILAVLSRTDGAEATILGPIEKESKQIISRSENLTVITELSEELTRRGLPVEVIIQRDPIQKPQSPSNQFGAFFNKYQMGIHTTLNAIDRVEVEQLISEILKARALGRQIFVMGNGGSAAAASHWVTDLAKERFQDDAARFKIISLTDNLPWITATANDFGYEKVFENQLKNLLREEDLVIAISSSGNSQNVIRAVEYANSRNAITIGVVGFGGGQLAKSAKKIVSIPTKVGHYGFMEDATSILGHIIAIHIHEMDLLRFT